MPDGGRDDGEERYRRAFADAPFPMAWSVVAGPDAGRLTAVNQALCTLTGYTEEELLALPPGGLQHPGESEAFDARMRALADAVEAAQAPVVRRCRRADGSDLWLRTTVTLARDHDGRVVSALSFMEDVSGLRDAESALVASEERFKQAFENAPIAMMLVDLHAGRLGMVLQANPAACRLFGYSSEAMLSKDIDTLTHPADRVTTAAAMAALADGSISSHRAEKRYLDAAGNEIWALVSHSSVHDRSGAPAYLVSQVVDVTDRMDAEAKLHQAQRLESVGQLAGGVAHDFNNLLAGIMNYAELVAMSIRDRMARADEPDDETTLLLQDVQEITNVARRAADLTHQLLLFSRRERVTLEILELNTIVRDMEKLFRRTIGENIDLRTALAPDVPLVKADRGQIEQVLMNLVVNARDAMPDGGRLAVETAMFTADELYSQSRGVPVGRYARLTVSDTGTGMAPGVAARAFEPFFSTKPKGTGSGLGLATVYGIVTAAGGDIVIYSEVGVGTTIRVLVPATAETPAAQVLPGRDPRRGNGQTVLLVEDEEMVREPASRMLTRYGFHVLTASDADEAQAIEASHDGVIDLLLTDVVMPGRSGKDLAGALLLRRPELRVLFMSGYSQDVIVHRGVLEEGALLLEKPFAADALLAAVLRALEGT